MNLMSRLVISECNFWIAATHFNGETMEKFSVVPISIWCIIAVGLIFCVVVMICAWRSEKEEEAHNISIARGKDFYGEELQ